MAEMMSEIGQLENVVDALGRQLNLLRWALDQIRRQRKALDLWEDAAREHRRNADDYRDRLRLHEQKAAGEYWAWQGGGEDHLETLCCPVLIQASVLRAMLENKTTT